MSHKFQLQALDHVGIRVKDFPTSIAWYESVLGMKKYRFDAWGDYPIFMLSGTFGVALFPVDEVIDKSIFAGLKVGIDHFAFRVDQENFLAAQKHYETLGLTFHTRDHHYFDSIYTRDPDGHIVELTALKVAAELVYGQ